ncbi:MAG: type II secretion system protein GspI [Gammaproteobacteria bacterium]|nr:MAG: type II secretion system protein GspI [Gammaproteobacteria bacterium]
MPRLQEDGFTLIEVMVALLIFSLVAATVMKSTSSAIQRQGTLESKMLAQWLAANAITDARLQKTLQTGRKTEQQSMGGRKWKVVREVVATPNPFIKEIRVTVSTDETGREPEQVAVVTGYAGTH